MPRSIGPEIYAGPPRGFLALSAGKRTIIVLVLVTLVTGRFLLEQERGGPPVPQIPLATFSEPSGQPPLIVPRAIGSGEDVDIIVSDDKNTFYFNNAPGRCYAYEIPGRWGWGSEEGLLYSIVGPEMVGVMLLSETDLKAFPGPNLIARGVKRITERYEQTIGQPLSAELLPIENLRFSGLRWKVSWVLDQTRKTHGLAEKVFLEVGPGWIAQVSVPPGEERLFQRLVETLSVTGHPHCYWPYLQRRYPGLFPDAASPAR